MKLREEELVPKGRWRLAGGVSHRLGPNNITSPCRGVAHRPAPTLFSILTGTEADQHLSRALSVAPAGAGLHFDVHRWLTPPANFRQPSGSVTTTRNRIGPMRPM